MFETPRDLGLKYRTIIPPEKGWEPSTYYVIDVAFNSINPIHRGIFYSGFLNENGTPQGYNSVITSDDASISDVYYMKALASIDIKALSFKCFE